MSNTKRSRRGKNAVNAGSMADIAFLLLIFFLVTTKIVEEQGILVKLPPYVNEPISEPVNQNNVFTVKVNALNQVLAEGKRIDMLELKAAAKDFITNPHQRTDRPKSPKNAVVSLQNDRGTEYQTYLTVYNELQAAYAELRENAAQSRFGTSYKYLNAEHKTEIRRDIPLIISEAESTEY